MYCQEHTRAPLHMLYNKIMDHKSNGYFRIILLYRITRRTVMILLASRHTILKEKTPVSFQRNYFCKFNSCRPYVTQSAL